LACRVNRLIDLTDEYLAEVPAMNANSLHRMLGPALLAVLSVTVLAGTALAEDRAALLWKLEGEENTVWLVGSVHALRDDHYPLPGAIEDAFDASRHLVVETDIINVDPQVQQRLMVSTGMLPPRTTLRDLVSQEEYRRIRELTEELGYRLSQLEILKPWLIGLSLTVAEMEKRGYHGGAGMEVYFIERAGEKGKSIHQFETLQFQLSLFDEMPHDAQIRFLIQSLEELRDLDDELDKLVEAWKDGDLDALEQVLLDGFDNYPELYERLVVERNRNWLPKIVGFTESQADYFVLVGALHLVGEDGLVRMLEAEGFQPLRQ
jgi:uncharacterized protein